MKNEIKVSGVSVSGEISYDMLNMFNKNENKTTPLMKLFWEQQKKASLAAKSASSYDELCEPNIICYPAEGLFEIIRMLLNLMLVLFFQ